MPHVFWTFDEQIRYSVHLVDFANESDTLIIRIKRKRLKIFIDFIKKIKFTNSTFKLYYICG